ncbi:hypothetical protein [Algoriphagus marinus]|uniref:hypothetical protein n=1 Tax=Algoriphagus marinus TaxID=1925762 RepID=UPI00094B92BD|nr:hypothetical protein [Algoriphagus marinus]
MNWYEELPDNCPPNDALVPDGKEFFRLCIGNPATSSDFYSQRKENTNRTFAGISECILRAVSLWDDENKCLQQKKYPIQKNKVLGKIELNIEDGLIKNTFKANHYSWWRSDKFDPALAIITDQ